MYLLTPFLIFCASAAAFEFIANKILDYFNS